MIILAHYENITPRSEGTYHKCRRDASLYSLVLEVARHALKAKQSVKQLSPLLL